MKKRRKKGEDLYGREVERFIAGLKERHGFDIASDPKRVRRELIQELKAALPVGRGRPRDESITEAERLRSAGRSWNEVTALMYSARWAKADKYERAYLTRQAQTAVKQRRRRDREARNGDQGSEETGSKALAGDGGIPEEPGCAVHAERVQAGGEGEGD